MHKELESVTPWTTRCDALEKLLGVEKARYDGLVKLIKEERETQFAFDPAVTHHAYRQHMLRVRKDYLTCAGDLVNYLVTGPFRSVERDPQNPFYQSRVEAEVIDILARLAQHHDDAVVRWVAKNMEARVQYVNASATLCCALPEKAVNLIAGVLP